MFKFVALAAFVAVAVAAPAPSGIELASPLGWSGNPWASSSLGLHSGALLQSAPLLHSAPLVHSAPWAHSAPLLHSAPLVAHQQLVAKQVIASEPVLSSVIKPAVTGYNVQHVPTAVSHQSQSIVHHDKIVTPVISPVESHVLSHAPVIKTIAAPAPYAISHGWNAHAAHGWDAHSAHGWDAHSAPLLSSW